VNAANLEHCPRCQTGLAALDAKCPTCGYTELANIDFLDVSDQLEYKQYLESQRVAWTDFDQSLREQLREVGETWTASDRWLRIWEGLKPKAHAIGFDEQAAKKRTEIVWRAFATPHFELIRQWVTELPDGKVDAVDWERFLGTLEGQFDKLLLNGFRDAEIERQFASFETAQVNGSGQVQKGERLKAKRLVEKIDDGCSLILLRIPGGEFLMGSERYQGERPVHLVTVAPFLLGQYPVTQEQWRAVGRLTRVDCDLGEDFSLFRGDQRPIDSVSWSEATEFCARLARETGKKYRLPSEAEWEYACRAGSTTDFAFGDTISSIIVNYDGSHPYGIEAPGIFRNETVAVGSLMAANKFGLFDMHGNVSEWCADEWHDTYEGAPQHGGAWISENVAAQRVVRGGSWANTAEICRSSDRSRESADPQTKLHYMSFRVAVDL
jgi:formylglycine-generating enzyme required for sulfatase activity